MSIDPATEPGAVRLTVADLDRVEAFYRDAVGLRSVRRDGNVARLGASTGRALVELVGSPEAPAPPPGGTGLFHLALRVPGRPDLALALRRVTGAGGSFTGASDHLVSEALYLNDPEGNGIEIYRDRPREQWRHVDGQLQMGTFPLDVDAVMAEVPADGGDDGLPAETRMGHVHLKVAGLAEAEAFYHGVLGFDVVVRSYPGALFVSAGGYHHHLGLNVWSSRGGPAPPPGSRGLRRFEIALPDRDALARVAERLERAGIEAGAEDGGLAVADPCGNRVLLRS